MRGKRKKEGCSRGKFPGGVLGKGKNTKTLTVGKELSKRGGGQGRCRQEGSRELRFGRNTNHIERHEKKHKRKNVP